MKNHLPKILAIGTILFLAGWILLRPAPPPSSSSLPTGWICFPQPGSVLALQAIDTTLYVGSKTGLHAFDTSSRSFLWSWNQSGKLDRIRALAPAPANSLWIAHESGLTLKTPSGETSFTPSDGLPSKRVNALAIAPNSTLWIGTANGLCSFSKNTFFPCPAPLASPIVNALAISPDGSLWAGSISDPAGGLTIITPSLTSTIFSIADGLPHPFVNQITLENSDTVWSVGGFFEKGAACSWKKENGAWKIHAIWNSKNGLPEDHVRSVFRDREGDLWFGFENQALAVCSNNSVRLFSKEDGFPSTEVTSFYQDANGVIWMGTLAGIVCVTPAAAAHFKKHGRSNPLKQPTLATTHGAGFN